MTSIRLPYPPTGNHAIRHTANGHYPTKELKAFRLRVMAEAIAHKLAEPLRGRLQVVCEITPPDRRRRDLDNAWKTIADACTAAGLWLDDSQIDDLRLIRGQPDSSGGGRVEILFGEV